MVIKNRNFIYLEEKILLTKDLSEVRKKVLEKNNSKIVGEIVCQKSKCC
jgi:hypothetical protein